jgi:hypothetical protein
VKYVINQRQHRVGLTGKLVPAARLVARPVSK